MIKRSVFLCPSISVPIEDPAVRRDLRLLYQFKRISSVCCSKYYFYPVQINLTLSRLSELPFVAGKILQFAGGKKVFAFYGEMGTGKTTLIKEICRQLGSNDNFSSPTYSIVNEYFVFPNSELKTQNSKLIYHIDLYRLKTLNEALEAGVGEYITGENYCFIEWPELVEPLLPADYVRIEIKMDENMREIAIFIG